VKRGLRKYLYEFPGPSRLVCESRALLCRSGGLAIGSCAEAEGGYSHNGAGAVQADVTFEVITVSPL
jgi:hypothetical protein